MAPQSIETVVKGRAFLLAGFDEAMAVTFRNYEKVPAEVPGAES